MEKQQYAQTLCPGDLIVVAYNNYLWPAIFIKYNKNNVPNYFLFNIPKLQYIENSFLRGQRPYVDYISRKGNTAIAKIAEEELSDEKRDIYYKMFDLLKKNNYI